MRRFPLFVLIPVFLLSLCSAADVLKVVIDDTIQPVSAERIERALDLAAAHKDDAVLIELSTPGGLMTSMSDIVQKILASTVPEIIYVTTSGNDAASLMRSIVLNRERNVDVAESTVRQSKSFTETEALSQKLIDYIAPNE